MMMIDESLIPSTSSSISTNPPNNISISNSSNVEQQSTLTTAKQMQNSDENERKREECLMRVLQKESRFEKLKPKCHKAKQDLFDKFQEAILNRRCDIFQRRKQQLDAEFDVRRKSIQSNRKIRMEMLARRQAGQRQIVQDNFEYEKMQVKRQIGDQIEEKLRAIDEEERRLEANLSEHLSASSSANPNGNASKIAKFQLERPTTNKNAKENGKVENGRRKRKAPIEEEEEEEEENGIGRNGGRLKLWKNLPVVIAKLPDKSIQEDLELFCCVKKERGD